ncbi:hypothetical protein RMQ97_13270 [Maricaulis sp. D1M11]|uniref:hypothetical protein n=1 Tax=Maricaulis sp. D1M11 TaxID=3076117 RepID=UPI0039B66276
MLLGMERIQITKDIVDELNRLQEQSGVGPGALLRGQKDTPPGLNSGTIFGWKRHTVKTAKRNQLEWVMKRWREVTPVVPMTPKLIKEIEDHLKRTGIAPRALIARIDPPLDKLRSELVTRWVKGTTKTARQDHLDAVLNELRAAPDALPREKRAYIGRDKFQRRLDFDDTLRIALETERERTGIQASEMLKYFYRGKVPDGLNAGMISSWINASPRTVPADLYEWTLAAWRALPDREE